MHCWLGIWAKAVIRWISIGLEFSGWGMLPWKSSFPGCTGQWKDADLAVCYVLAGGPGAPFPCAVFQFTVHWKGEKWSLPYMGALLCQEVQEVQTEHWEHLLRNAFSPGSWKVPSTRWCGCVLSVQWLIEALMWVFVMCHMAHRKCLKH